jgi:trimethylamine--corrinoid protein Co-methyltransferase
MTSVSKGLTKCFNVIRGASAIPGSLPYYSPLSSDDALRIDQAARRILERVGVAIWDTDTLEILRAAGARVDFGSQRVWFDVEMLDQTIGCAPHEFKLYSRDGRNDVYLGTGRVQFANGGRVFRMQNSDGADSRYTLLRDVAHTAALVDSLSYIDFYIIACQAHDVEPRFYHLNDFFQAFSHTTKHVMGGCDDVEGVQQVWGLASLIAGSSDRLRDRPIFSIITNPMSPLTIDGRSLGVLRFCCQHGIPVTCAPAPVAGATAPAALAGTLAQMHAEALAGMAIGQVFSPGARMLYGAVPNAMDLRHMELALGSPEMAMMNAAAVQLARLYRLPIYASAGVSESKTCDVQAGIEKTLSQLLVAMAGADCVHLAAGMLDSGNAVSYEQYVIDNEIIGAVTRVLRGIAVSDKTLAMPVIEKVGPGGHFVLEDHTIQHMMDEFFYPDLAIRMNFDIWEKENRPSMLSRAKAVANRELEVSKKTVMEPALLQQIRECFPGIRDD